MKKPFENMHSHRKKAVAAVILGIVSLAYFMIAGMPVLVLIAVRTPIKTLIYVLTAPASLSFAGLALSVYSRIKERAKPLSIVGIVLNSIALSGVAALGGLIGYLHFNGLYQPNTGVL
ncbi:MAG: hypothetical protein LBL66_03645 [Clostridiales bacterium]|jgi:hypothetical protein|nr:hypothetical protein [Clostridiales bacterium]